MNPITKELVNFWFYHVPGEVYLVCLRGIPGGPARAQRLYPNETTVIDGQEYTGQQLIDILEAN